MEHFKHYSLANHATQFDEESLTVLEMCARLAAKFNGLIDECDGKYADMLEAIESWMGSTPNASAVLNNYLTPQGFGAKGDGITDDTNAIKTALSLGRDVYFPAGAYKVSESIALDGCKHIYGDGDASVIVSSAPVIITTNAEGCVIERLRIQGNNTNTGIALYKDRNTVSNVSIANCSVGIKNKNSDYMGSVKIVDTFFDYVNTCFYCDVLCNGVNFRGCVAYHYTTIAHVYWMEGVSFANCFFEKSNEDAVVMRQIETKSALQCLGVSFNGCYIEAGSNFQFFEVNAIGGTLTFVGCWIKPAPDEAFIDCEGLQSSARFTFIGNTFNPSSSSHVVMRFGDDQTAVCFNNTSIVSGKGVVAFNITGENIPFNE